MDVFSYPYIYIYSNYVVNVLTLYCRLCHEYEAYGSGYVEITDMVLHSTSMHKYTTTRTSSQKCFLFDFTSPTHCAADMTPCPEDPLDIGPRRQKHKDLKLKFEGYYDPDPISITGSSGISHFGIKIYEMNIDNENEVIKVDFLKTIYRGETKDTHYFLDLPETPDPMMYAVYLTTLDVAGNFKMTRRFVIVDNTSYIEMDPDNPPHVSTADPDTDYLWQTKNNSLFFVDWNGYFFNEKYQQHNFLWPIMQDGNVSGVFEQETHPLPVSGTPNVHGIVDFQYALNVRRFNGTEEHYHYQSIIDLTTEGVLLTYIVLLDGDLLQIDIKAEDIMINSIIDSTTVHFDSSPPTMESLGLWKDDEEVLYIERYTSLANLDLKFMANDPHSGIWKIYVKLGTVPGKDDIGYYVTMDLGLTDEVSNYIIYLCLPCSYKIVHVITICISSSINAHR